MHTRTLYCGAVVEVEVLTPSRRARGPSYGCAGSPPEPPTFRATVSWRDYQGPVEDAPLEIRAVATEAAEDLAWWG